MAKSKDLTHLSASDIAVILSYLLEINISASDIYIAMLQLELVTKDFKTREWTPSEKGKSLQKKEHTKIERQMKKSHFLYGTEM